MYFCHRFKRAAQKKVETRLDKNKEVTNLKKISNKKFANDKSLVIFATPNES